MYIKDNNTIIPAGYKQTFQNKFTINISSNEIIKMKNDGTLKDRDLDISKFLFTFKFATVEQIQKYLKTDISLVSLKARLDKLVNYRILNKFMLSENEEEKINPDALHFYCLDLGAKFLLTHYSNEDTSDWYVIRNMLTSEHVAKALVATEFYLKVRETCEDRIIFFNVNPELRIGKKNVIPTFEMCLKIDGEIKYFIGEVAKENDLSNEFRKKIDKIETLLMTNSWKKYYYESETAPILFVFSETDMLVNKCAKIISETTTIENFRLSTEGRIKRNLYDKGAFLKYLKYENKLKEIRASIFDPKKE